MKTIRTAFFLFLVLTLLTGGVYPFLVTGIVQLLFPRQANGNMVVVGGKTVGSLYIGQSFDSTVYFSGRPSATGYNPLPSGGSNLGPGSKKLFVQMVDRQIRFRKSNLLPENFPVPAEMIFASASGIDPDISTEAALLQVNRISLHRGFSVSQKGKLIRLIHDLIIPPGFFLQGEPRINVFELNLETDKIQ